MQTKCCTKCGEEKPLDAYNKHKLGKLGLAPSCRSCQKEYKRSRKAEIAAWGKEYRAKNKDEIARKKSEYYQANKDKKREYDQAYYKKHKARHLRQSKEWYLANKQKANQFRKEYYQANKDRHLQKCREWRKNNSERVKQLNRDYYLNNRNYYAAASKRYKVAKLNRTPDWLNKAHHVEIEAMYLYNQIMPGDWHVDHIIPLQGEEVSGLHVPWNLQVISAKENLAKSNLLLDEAA